MQIIVHVCGNTHVVDVAPSDTVGDVRARLSQECDHLVFEFYKLEDGSALSDYNIQHLSILYAKHVLDIMFGNHTLKIDVEATESILYVKELIAARYAIPSWQQTLTLGHWQLDNTRALSDYDIKKNAFIMLGAVCHCTPGARCGYHHML
jgi:hypothetical protein